MSATSVRPGGRAAAGRGDLPPPLRLPLLALGFASLLLGVWAGLVRLGWAFPLPRAELLLLHGPLMASGFFGTVIGLERAVAAARRPAYLGPAATALGAVLLVAGAPALAGIGAMALGSGVLALTTADVWRRQRTLFNATLLAGALCWLTGNILWLAGVAVAGVVPWWAAFLVLTIAGERLELSRLLPPAPAAQRLFGAGLLLFLALLVLGAWFPETAARPQALVLLALTAWLVRYDIARRTVRQAGLTRFIAVALLSAYGWLAVSALLGLLPPGLAGGSLRDAVLHTLFLGFVFSMVFGHAPVILPAVTRFAVDYHPVFYLHLLLLHASLALRVAADLGGWTGAVRLAGLINGLALLLFMANTIAGVWRGRRRRRA